MQEPFDKVSFGFREHRMFLFWITHPGHAIFSGNVVALYKDNQTHVYYLNGAEDYLSEKGYKMFSKKGALKNYKKLADGVIKMIDKTELDYEQINFKTLSDKKLKEVALSFFDKMHHFSAVYARTEPQSLTKIDLEEKRFKELIKGLGKARFALRKKGEVLWGILPRHILKEVVRRYKVKMSDLFFYTATELEQIFDGKKVSKKNIDARKKGYTLICEGKKKTILVGDKFKQLFNEIVAIRPGTNILKGQVAMKGMVTGRIRVISHDRYSITKKVKQFRKGEILVTEMTRPDTIFACRKAAAIITDEGGITSHAAVISREMKIPCIVGTKIATQVLKSGMMVEVDAGKGIIKIIR